MLICGIDQISILVTYPLAHINRTATWDLIASDLVCLIDKTLDLSKLFGPRHSARGVAHYDTCYEYGNSPYKFYVAYNANAPSTGILIYFSAGALNEYRLKYHRIFNKVINANDILRMLSLNDLDNHISRLDVYADFFDEDICLTDLYNKHSAGDIKVMCLSGKRNQSKWKCYSSGNTVETIYIGTRQKNSKCLARFYDKKAEQLRSNNSVYYKKAKECSSWKRLELELHSLLARQVTTTLAECQEEDIQGFAASLLLNRLMFVDTATNTPLKITTDLEKKQYSKDIVLAYPAPGNSDLLRRYEYIINGSGLFDMFDKVKAIWGPEGVTMLIDSLSDDYAKHTVKKSTNKWILRYGDQLSSCEPPFGIRSSSKTVPKQSQNQRIK